MDFQSNNDPNSFDYNNGNTPPAAPPQKTLAIISMIAGIVSIISCGGCGLTPIAGLILGILSIRKKEDGKGMAMAGIITSAVSIVIGLIFWLIWGIAMVASYAASM